MHSLAGKDFLTLKGLERADLELIFDVARPMEAIVRRRTRIDLLKDKCLGLMFFQVSTRTRISFESAMQRLGGGVVGFVDPASTRIGDYYAESLHEVVRMMEHYADVLVIRHPKDGAPAQAAAITDVPVINAGDGYNEHPTQGLLDAYTILREKGQLDGLRIGVVGDLKQRTLHSLALPLAQYRSRVTFIAQPEDPLPSEWDRTFRQVGLLYDMATSIDDVIQELDVLYVMTTKTPSYSVGRSQAVAERPKTPSAFVLDRAKLARGKKDLIVLHPLPRTDELPQEVDTHASARYFVQAFYGVVIRMALLALVLVRAP